MKIVKFLLIVCLPFIAFAEEIKDSPTTLVVFGATGDLTSKKILPAVEVLTKEGKLPKDFTLVGVARKSEEEFRKKIGPGHQIVYCQVDFDAEEGYKNLKKLLHQIDGGKGTRIYYLSTPASYFSSIVEKLHKNGMVPKETTRVLIEKPFGSDLNSALELQNELSRYLDDSQIYRIDHYLGKEGVKNLTDFRLGKKLESVWNREHIEKVELILSEDIGIGSRALFWEETGLLRDIVQNHMMQLLSLTAMEVSEDIVKEKTKVLKAIRSLNVKEVVRGQYGSGEINGTKVVGYKQETGIPPNSKVETYVAATLYIDNDRWQGVPFTLRSGKRLAEQLTEIVITFKSKEVLHIRIQPKPAIYYEGKAPFVFDPYPYSEAYQKLIIDAIQGNTSSFVTKEEQIAAWNLVTPVLEYWKKSDLISAYPAGSKGP